jgi:hypothetical protein
LLKLIPEFEAKGVRQERTGKVAIRVQRTPVSQALASNGLTGLFIMDTSESTGAIIDTTEGHMDNGLFGVSVNVQGLNRSTVKTVTQRKPSSVYGD